MSRLVLYILETSPPACAVRALGDLLGLEFDLKILDFTKMEHKSPEYMKINPMGTIPTLVDGDFVLSDSNAIMMYLLTKYGGDKAEILYPSEVRTRAIVDQCLFFNAGVFFIKLKNVALPTFFEGLEGPTAKHLSDIESSFCVVEAYLTRRYVAADRLTIADLALGTTANSLRAIYTLDAKKFPRTTAWLELLDEEPAFKKYFSTPAINRLATALKTYWDMNKKH